MQEIITWLCCACMTVGLLFTGIGSKTVCMEKRKEKQDLNLAGKIAVSFFEKRENEFEFDESAYTEKLKRMLGKSFTGAVFLYGDKVTGISENGKRTEYMLSEINGDRMFAVNKTANAVLKETECYGKRIEIRSGEDDGDNYDRMLFNSPESGEINIFVLSCSENYVNVAGFTLYRN